MLPSVQFGIASWVVMSVCGLWSAPVILLFAIIRPAGNLPRGHTLRKTDAIVRPWSWKSAGKRPASWRCNRRDGCSLPPSSAQCGQKFCQTARSVQSPAWKPEISLEPVYYLNVDFKHFYRINTKAVLPVNSSVIHCKRQHDYDWFCPSNPSIH